MTTLDLYTPTDSHSITLDFKTLDGLREALTYPLYLSARGREELDNFIHFYTMGTQSTRSIYNDMVQLYKLEDGAIIAMNTADADISTVSLVNPTEGFRYNRYNTSFKEV